MSYFKTWRALTAVLAAALVTGACAGSGGGQTAGTDDSRSADRAAEITVAQFGAPSIFDPHLSRNPNADPAYFNPVYDQLLRLDKAMQIQPMLASSYEMAPDGSALTLHLRTEARFQDGSGFDAAVVKANLDRARTLPGSTAAPQLANITSVDVVDPATARITFAKPDQTFPYTLAANLNLGSMISGKAIAAGTDLTRTPAGSGPYKLVDFQQDRATFERDDTYWNADRAPAVRRVTLVGMPDDNARLAGVQSGQLQVAAVRPNQASAYQPIVDAGEATLTSFPGEVGTLYLNTKTPGLADPRVRHALSMAIDREAINQALFAGAGAPAYQFYPEGMPGWTAAADENPYDPEGAKKLLAEAGQPNLRLKVILTSTEPTDSIAQIVQAQLAQVGVTLDLQKFAPTDSRPSWRKGVADAFSSTVQLGGDPGVLVGRFLLGPDNPGGAPANVAAVSGTALGASLIDPQRAARFEDLTTLLTTEPVHVPVVRVPLQYLAQPSVMNVGDTALGQLTSMIDVRTLAVAAQA